MMKSPSRWFGQAVGDAVCANADGAASARSAADSARMIIGILPFALAPEQSKDHVSSD
jgi:hypothetical protein